MVIVRLTGGIGNQMFQYAAARRISLINGSQILLDLSWFQEEGWWTKRKYELDSFCIKGKAASKDQIEALKSKRQNILLRHLPFFLRKIFFHYNQSHIVEKKYNFDPDIMKLRGNVYLDGYWQSEKYFKDIESSIRLEFSFRKDVLESNKKFIDYIHSCHSVSIHIRRGDYVTLPEANVFHGICSKDYYQRAVRHISRKVANPVFFVFSDDIIWAKQNMDLGFETCFIDQNGPDSGDEDMRLMSACCHHIIANSSFSWWGAWLNPSPDKIVIAPESWFKKAPHNTLDLIPDTWIKL